MVWLWIGLGIFFLFGLFPMLVVCYAGKQAFGRRFDAYNSLYETSDFPGLSVWEKDIRGNRGQRIRVFAYTCLTCAHKKGVVFWSSGIGGDHSSYLPLLNVWAQRGWTVVAYDPTGTGKSGGASVRGLTQNLLDGRAVLQWIGTDPALSALPLVAAGHSNGAFAALALLNEEFPIRGAAVFAPFHRAFSMIMFYVDSFAHGLGRGMKPYIWLYYRLRFGADWQARADDGIRSARKPVFLVQSREDDVVPYREFLRFRSIPGHPASVFRTYDGRWHEAMFPPGIARQLHDREKAVNSQLIGPKPRGEKARAAREECLQAYVRDYRRMAVFVDVELLEEIDAFWEAHCLDIPPAIAAETGGATRKNQDVKRG